MCNPQLPRLAALLVLVAATPLLGQIPDEAKFANLFKPGQTVIVRPVRDAGTSLVQVLTDEQANAFAAKRKAIEKSNQEVADKLETLQSKLDASQPIAAAKLLKQEYELERQQQRLPINGSWYLVSYAGEDYVRLQRDSYTKFVPHRSISHIYQSETFWTSSDSSRRSRSSAASGRGGNFPTTHAEVLQAAFPEAVEATDRPPLPFVTVQSSEDNSWVLHVIRRLDAIRPAEQD